MGNDTSVELLQSVADTWQEYVGLTDQHAQLSRAAHRAPHGSGEMIQALRCANELGPHVMMALRRYLDAVEILTALYRSTPVASRQHVPLAKQQRLRLAS